MEKDVEAGLSHDSSVHENQDLLERVRRLEKALYAQPTEKERLPGLAPAKTQDPRVANSATLGLFGFGFTTMLLSFVNAGVVDASTGGVGFIISFMFFYGGLAQVVAGIMAFIRKDMLGASAFTSYGTFWMAEGLTQVLVGQSIVTPGKGFEDSAVVALSVWAVITFAFTLGTLHKPLALQLVFISLTITFILLAAGVYTHVVQQIGGAFGILTACLALYTGACDLVLDTLNFKMPGMKSYFPSHVE
ncbi:Meiotically up-regulated 86 protein [Porphyridium purpureum]|uniref:Meiotically up-regulated 86 protein n=1 Tax=Porphyridium purpureum TaxID=35688 RepID=A0A5J4YM26_PORPP|nr:Meiotically up-regulated 86 protein [Porphyridium purpureum]|eukprot:POR6900..scf295_9